MLNQVKDVIYNIFKEGNFHPILELRDYFANFNSRSLYNASQTDVGFYGVDSYQQLIYEVLDKSKEVNPDVIIVNGDFVT